MTFNVTLKDPLQGVLPMTPDSANRSHPATMSSFFRKWATENNMVLHDSKFEYLAYRTASSKLLEEFPFTAQWVQYSTPSGQDLTPASSVKDLAKTWNGLCKLLSQLKMQIKWPTGCSVSFQTGLKMCSLPFTRLLSVADSNIPVQYGIHPQCKTSRNWNPLNVLSLATLVDARVCHIGRGRRN